MFHFHLSFCDEIVQLIRIRPTLNFLYCEYKYDFVAFVFFYVKYKNKGKNMF